MCQAEGVCVSALGRLLLCAHIVHCMYYCLPNTFVYCTGKESETVPPGPSPFSSTLNQMSTGLTTYPAATSEQWVSYNLVPTTINNTVCYYISVLTMISDCNR